MGADINIVATRAPRNKYNDVIFGDRLVELAEERIRVWNPEPWLFDDYDRYLDEWIYDHEDEVPEDGELTTEQKTAILRDALRKALTELNFYREIDERKFEGVPYWLTGGMSWGDSPTESYEPLCLIASSGIFEQPFEVTE